MDTAGREIPDAVRKAASRLAERDEPRRALEEVDAAGIPAGWRAALDAFVEPEPTSSHALRVADRLRELGWSDERVPSGLARLVDAAGIPPTWADWEAIDDRDELLLRLRVLARTDLFDGSMVSFVAFFFRASDRELYQSAAVAAGRHLDESPGLAEQLEDWLDKHGRSLEGPVRLDGTRPSRRLLLLRAARRGTGSRVGVLPDDLVETARSRTTPDRIDAVPDRLADLAVLLTACRVLARGEARGDAAEVARGLSFHVASLPTEDLDRAVVERWALLLVEIVSEPPGVEMDVAVDAWWALIRRRLEPPPEAGFGSTMKELICLDEAVRVPSAGPEHLVDAISGRVPDAPTREDRVLVEQRLAAWTRRYGSPEEVPRVDDAELTEPLASAVALVGEEAASRLLGGPGRRRSLAFIESSLTHLAERTSWRVQDVGTRALRGMLLLDAVRHAELDADQVEALMERYGFPSPLGDTGRADPWTTRPGDVLAVGILLRLLRWEGSGAETFLDPVAIARFEDVRLLEALLVGRHDEAMLVHLADSIEHQLRWQLRRRTDFDLERYLVRLTVCDPGPRFFDHLAEVARERTYLDANGDEVPVHDLVRAVGADQRDGGSDVPFEGAFASGLQTVRERLVDLAEPDDLRSRLAELADLVGDPAGRSPTRGTLLWVLDQVRRRGEPMIRSEPPVWSEDSYDGLAELGGTFQRVGTRARELLPDAWSDIDEVHAAVTDIHDLLDGVALRFPGPLPRVEADLLEAALAELRDELDAWEDRVDRVAEVRAAAETRSDWRSVLDVATTTWDRPVRRDILVGLWREAAGDGAAPDLLDEVLASDLRDRWDESETRAMLDAMGATWRRTVEDALERGDEAAVTTLLTADRYGPLRRHADGKDLARDARQWLLERFRILGAARVDRAFRPEAGGARLRAIGGFLATFAPVWLAVAVGAVLMFDFGDPWTALAEAGDWRGIWITFLVGVVGTFLYVGSDLHRKIEIGDRPWRRAVSIAGRATGFVALCLTYTIAVVGLLWWMFAGTGQVVTGAGAVGHVLVWTGFAIFVGIFFGLIAQST